MFRLQRVKEQPSPGNPDRTTTGERGIKLLATLDDEQTMKLAVDAYWNLLQSMLPSEDGNRDLPPLPSLN